MAGCDQKWRWWYLSELSPRLQVTKIQRARSAYCRTLQEVITRSRKTPKLSSVLNESGDYKTDLQPLIGLAQTEPIPHTQNTNITHKVQKVRKLWYTSMNCNPLHHKSHSMVKHVFISMIHIPCFTAIARLSLQPIPRRVNFAAPGPGGVQQRASISAHSAALIRPSISSSLIEMT